MTVSTPARTTPAPRPAPSRFALWAPVAAYMALIFALSSVKRLPALPGGISDTVEHVVEYAGLGALLLRAHAGGRWAGVRRGAVVAAAVVAVIFGVSDEVHQAFVPGRECDVRDLAADALGAGAAVGVLWAWGIIRRFSGVHGDCE